jgi:hypothetical protein
MRTKTLLLAAVLGLASAATSMAQVYSANVVGYVNVSLASGFNLLGNPLVSSNNTIKQVLPSVPEGAQVFKLLPSGAFNVDFYAGGVWYDTVSEAPSTTTLAPGEGFFLYTLATSNITFVGEVKQGTNTVTLNNGFSLVSSVAPQVYSLVSPNFPAADGQQHYKLVGNNYQISSYSSALSSWYDNVTEANVTLNTEVAKGFFIYRLGAPTSWTRVFNVN